MRILVTGCAGFVGFHVAKKFIQKNYQVIGIDSLNNYYDKFHFFMNGGKGHI